MGGERGGHNKYKSNQNPKGFGCKTVRPQNTGREMRIEEENGITRIYVRQSWLGDALMCPERARLISLHPETRKENDSAMMGTACHAGIEAVLRDEISPLSIGEYSISSFRAAETDLLNQNKKINITNTEPRNWDKHIASMSDAWVRDIMPLVPKGGVSEFKFSAKVADVADAIFPYELWFEGTMDYFHPTEIWDWKTAARKYYQAEKQNQNIQSAVYAKAATSLGLIDYDVKFNFGVMIRNASSTGQIVPVVRTANHGDWIVEQTKTLVNNLLTISNRWPSSRWLANDQHFLCSERWCPVWSMCKGSYITSDNNNAEEA